MQHEKDAIATDTSPANLSQSLYFKSLTIKPLCILIILFLCQEMSGMYNILFYTVEFFQDANVDIDEYVSSIIVGFIRLIMALAAAILIAKCTRKSLCITSATGMAISMLATASYLKYYDVHPANGEKLLPMLPLICLLFNVLFSMIGMLPVPWILVGELFPLEVRSIMSGVVICTAQCFIFLMVKLYPMVISLMGFSNTLYVFAASSAFTVFFVKFVLPETKNKSLMEIENNLQGDCNTDSSDVESDSGCVNKGFSMEPETEDKHRFRGVDVRH